MVNSPSTQMLLSEIYINAVEHSILELDSYQKADTEGFFKFYQDKETALAQLKGASISFNLSISSKANKQLLLIQLCDNGRGFSQHADDPLGENTLIVWTRTRIS